MLDESGTLCTSCNLCCDGTLFFGIALSDAEVDQMRKRVDIFSPPSSDKKFFNQPCQQLGRDGACKCYDVRPQGCIEYKCDLLNRLENAEIDFAFANTIVPRVRQFLKLATDACHEATPDEYRVQGNKDAFVAFRALKNAISAGATIDHSLKNEAFFQWTIYKSYVNRHIQTDFGDSDECAK